MPSNSFSITVDYLLGNTQESERTRYILIKKKTNLNKAKKIVAVNSEILIYVNEWKL